MREIEPLEKHTLNFYEGDWEKLGQLFPKTETSLLIRELVRDCIKRVEESAAAPKSLSAVEIKI